MLIEARPVPILKRWLWPGESGSPERTGGEMGQRGMFCLPECLFHVMERSVQFSHSQWSAERPMSRGSTVEEDKSKIFFSHCFPTKSKLSGWMWGAYHPVLPLCGCPRPRVSQRAAEASPSQRRVRLAVTTSQLLLQQS